MIRAVGIALLLISGAYSQNVNDTCECVEYFQCNYNGQVNEDGEGIIDIRTGVVDDNPFAQRRQCKHYLEVCCLPPEIKQGHDNNPVSPPVDPSNPLNPVNPNEQTQNPNTGDQGGNNDQITGIKGPHVSRGCGYRNPQGVGFRIQGNFNNEANFGEFPWTVAILRDDKVQDNTVRVYACGGTLIHKRAVLTAAHCVYGREASSLTVRAGEWDTQTTNEPLPHQDQKVSIVAMNPNYQTGSLQNNFAILILTKAVELADNVEVACLPEPNQNFDYSKCFATGWGKDQFGKEGHYQVILKAVELPVVPNNECQEALRRTRLGRYFKLHESFLCAGGAENTDTCTGDGGSPLVCPLGGSDPNRYTQAGIVSWGIGCGTKGVPGVYADVSKARLWIDETLRNYNMDISSYVPSADNGNNFNGNGLNRIGTVGLKPIGMRVSSSIAFN